LNDNDNWWKQMDKVHNTQINETETNQTETHNTIPSSLLVCNTLQQHESRQLFKVLMDSGATHSMMHARCLPPGATPTLTKHERKINTIAGNLHSNRTVYMEKIVLPEFDRSRKIDGLTVHLFDSPCNYDIILGRDLLEKIGLIINFADRKMIWLDREVMMKTQNFWNNPASFYSVFDDDDDDSNDLFEHFTAQILDAKYDSTTTQEVIDKQTHLNEYQKAELKKVLDKYGTLFDGTLGHYPHYKVNLKVDQSMKPVHAKPYPVPFLHQSTFKKELQHLCKIGVLREAPYPTQWASPTFITPKRMVEYVG